MSPPLSHRFKYYHSIKTHSVTIYPYTFSYKAWCYPAWGTERRKNLVAPRTRASTENSNQQYIQTALTGKQKQGIENSSIGYSLVNHQSIKYSLTVWLWLRRPLVHLQLAKAQWLLLNSTLVSPSEPSAGVQSKFMSSHMILFNNIKWLKWHSFNVNI
jgi:hypothetical protein